MRHRNSTPDHRVSEEVQKAEASWFWPIKSREQALETVRDVSTLLFDAAFFDKMSSQWREEQNRCQREIDRHQNADRTYLEEGVQLLELAALKVQFPTPGRYSARPQS